MSYWLLMTCLFLSLIPRPIRFRSELYPLMVIDGAHQALITFLYCIPLIDPAAVASQKAQQQQTQGQQTSQQQATGAGQQQQQAAETAGSIKATEPMWRCSRIMHMQKELHPTVLASLEGIVDQVMCYNIYGNHVPKN